MNWKMLGFLVVAIAPGALAVIPGNQDCAFTVIQDAPHPEIIGSDDVSSRTQVLNEPGFPVVIVRVDLSEVAREKNEKGLLAIGGTHRVEIQNVSDRVLDEIWVGAYHRLKSGAGWSGGATPTRSPLGPGQRVWMLNGVRSESGEPVAVEAQFQTIVSFDSARFATCVYRPKLAWHSPDWRLLP